MNIPKGWKLVPEEPTSHMKVAGEEWAEKGFNWPAAIYRAMTRAAPTPPAQEDEPVAVIDESDDGKFADLTIEGTFLKRGTKLYTRPDNSKLRKAAEAFIKAYKPGWDHHGMDEYNELRTAIEETK